MRKSIIIVVIIILSGFITASAKPANSKSKRENGAIGRFEYRVKAGFNIGGTSPIPLPREIRSVNGYSPSLSLGIGAEVIRHINSKWGIMTGLTLEEKGMRAKARVKNYFIEMTISDGETSGFMEGVFTGEVKTRAKNTYLTLPISGIYKISPRWELDFGVFLSLLLDGDFRGEAFNGYIRDGDPTGELIRVTSASYNFSDKIRNFNWGAQFGARWRAYRQFSVYGDLSWAANSIFKSDFTGISFDMYNVYLNLGFAYTF